nr:hypothetical protein [uncultured Flavonifractor sp.]
MSETRIGSGAALAAPLLFVDMENALYTGQSQYTGRYLIPIR